MKFGPVAIGSAVGGILAHSQVLPDGRLRKGRVITADDVERLRTAGLSEILVARLETGDVGEDAAAARLAAELVPDPEAAGLVMGAAATGRVNLHAAMPGVLEVDAARVDALNAVHPMITVATLRPWTRLGAREMAATIKIISYGVPETALATACREAAGALRLHRVRRRRVALIETVVGGEPASPKGRRAIAARLSRMGAELVTHLEVRHDMAQLADALGHVEAEVVLILTASATSDRQDTAPEALRRAGGVVEHFGMPVDPGNLLFLGRLHATPVIGLPGCARSLALNGADWVLDRVLCDVEVGPREIMGMGVGGLLKEPPSRPRRREG